ncbi:hypothetical protein [Micromonospora sp. B9E7]|uniref:hypothetical protein n=1 Tax=Micromonospora sp. B9E7 TaxID=3153574 RepID=UPI00325D2ECC
MAAGQVAEHHYQALRLDIPVDEPFTDFRRRYEEAVPPYDRDAYHALVARQAPWSDVLDLARRQAPYNFLIYWSSGDVQPLMRLAGDSGHCVEYLMGNHTTAERMFRHDPAIMLYAPLRTAITSNDDGSGTRFHIEKPSHAFASFSRDDITPVGVELDHEVAALLSHLGAPVPAALAG